MSAGHRRWITIGDVANVSRPGKYLHEGRVPGLVEANRALQEEQQHHRDLRARLRDIISRMQQSLT